MTTILGPLPERTNAVYTATLTDETGAALDATSLDTFTLTLADQATGRILNSRDGQSVLNANNVTATALGAVTWAIQPADTVIVDRRKAVERHVALFEATWATGAKQLRHEVYLDVTNLERVS